MGSLPVIAAILLAVLGLVWLSARLGFAGETRLPAGDELGNLLDSLPGGFAPLECITSTDDCFLLAVDARERVAIVAPHGAHLLARLVSRRTSVVEDGTTFTVRDGRLLARFDAGQDAASWRSRLCRALGEA